MRLKLVRVQNYKRFASVNTLDTRGPVVAIVGPNEAGKTSLLDAITHISSTAKFEQREFTDRSVVDRNEWVVQAHFALEDEDRAALGDILPAGLDPTYIYWRYPDGNARYSLDPAVHRDRTPRNAALTKLTAALAGGWLEPSRRDDEDDDEVAGSALADRAAELVKSLRQDTDTLEPDVRKELEELAHVLNRDVPDDFRDVPEELRGDLDIAQTDLGTALSNAAAFENATAPSRQIHALLEDRVPEVLLFGDEARDLDTEYVWGERATPTPALDNLFQLGRVDYQEFKRAAMADDRARMESLQEAANSNLEEAFRAWRQADLHVAFSADQRSLQLLVRDRATKERTRLDDRSAGLRTFVALVAFTARFGGEHRPVLLVDEAETHLHYGAQADLVRVFERQRAAETIIYTTHSIGCLPNDLGATIRVVSPVEGEYHRSVVRNSFWDGEQRAGLTPMMLAMGASALAFTPSRRAVIGEGPSEAILLPSLIREALPPEVQYEPLGYQVAPGIAEIRPDDAAELELEASGVAYLIDADAGGRKHTRKLSQRAHDEGRVVVLGEGAEEGLAIEDFVAADILADAFNALLDRRQQAGTDRISADELPGVDRAGYLTAWCKRRGAELRKGQLAQEALDIGRARERLLEPARAQQVRELHEKLLAATAATGVPDRA